GGGHGGDVDGVVLAAALEVARLQRHGLAAVRVGRFVDAVGDEVRLAHAVLDGVAHSGGQVGGESRRGGRQREEQGREKERRGSELGHGGSLLPGSGEQRSPVREMASGDRTLSQETRKEAPCREAALRRSKKNEVPGGEPPGTSSSAVASERHVADAAAADGRRLDVAGG